MLHSPAAGVNRASSSEAPESLEGVEALVQAWKELHEELYDSQEHLEAAEWRAHWACTAHNRLRGGMQVLSAQLKQLCTASSAVPSSSNSSIVDAASALQEALQMLEAEQRAFEDGLDSHLQYVKNDVDDGNAWSRGSFSSSSSTDSGSSGVVTIHDVHASPCFRAAPPGITNFANARAPQFSLIPRTVRPDKRQFHPSSSSADSGSSEKHSSVSGEQGWHRAKNVPVGVGRANDLVWGGWENVAKDYESMRSSVSSRTTLPPSIEDLMEKLPQPANLSRSSGQNSCEQRHRVPTPLRRHSKPVLPQQSRLTTRSQNQYQSKICRMLNAVQAVR